MPPRKNSEKNQGVFGVISVFRGGGVLFFGRNKMKWRCEMLCKEEK